MGIIYLQFGFASESMQIDRTQRQALEDCSSRWCSSLEIVEENRSKDERRLVLGMSRGRCLHSGTSRGRCILLTERERKLLTTGISKYHSSKLLEGS
jgi:hypothetical protein